MALSRVLTAMLLVSLMSWCQAELALFDGQMPHPGGISDARGRHQVVLGALQKVNKVVQPKAAEVVFGERRQAIYRVLDLADVEPVAEHYLQALTEDTTLLFHCAGRDCGSSNYWANTVCGDRILYGPEQFQHYMIGVDAATGRYRYVYIGQRGTGDIYVAIGQVLPASQEIDRAAMIALALRQTGRYVMPSMRLDGQFSTADLLTALGQVDGQLAVVGHSSLQDRYDTVSAATRRSDAAARALRDQLVEGGLAPARISVFAAGPMAPSTRYRSDRLELVLLRASGTELQERQ